MKRTDVLLGLVILTAMFLLSAYLTERSVTWCTPHGCIEVAGVGEPPQIF